MSLSAATRQFLRSVVLQRERVPDFDVYPFSIPAVRTLDRLDLHPQVTFVVGENGSGKSTLIEAIAIALGFNPAGGTLNYQFATHPTESDLSRYLRLIRGMHRPQDAFFLRAESFFNVSTAFGHELMHAPTEEFEERHGEKPPHELSHGEAFFALIRARFGGNGLYLLDEPEAALSPSRQLAFLCLLDDLTKNRNSQFLISTHSPILMAFPRAHILELGAHGIRRIAYEETEHFRVTRDFLTDHRRFLHGLLANED